MSKPTSRFGGQRALCQNRPYRPRVQNSMLPCHPAVSQENRAARSRLVTQHSQPSMNAAVLGMCRKRNRVRLAGPRGGFTEIGVQQSTECAGGQNPAQPTLCRVEKPTCFEFHPELGAEKERPQAAAAGYADARDPSSMGVCRLSSWKPEREDLESRPRQISPWPMRQACPCGAGLG